MILLPPSRCVNHLMLCTVSKAERKTRKLNVFLLINSIACNELTIACHVYQSQVIESMHGPRLLLVDMSKNKKREGVNVPCLSVLGLFGFRKMTQGVFDSWTFQSQRLEKVSKKSLEIKQEGLFLQGLEKDSTRESFLISPWDQKKSQDF